MTELGPAAWPPAPIGTEGLVLREGSFVADLDGAMMGQILVKRATEHRRPAAARAVARAAVSGHALRLSSRPRSVRRGVLRRNRRRPILARRAHWQWEIGKAQRGSRPLGEPPRAPM